MLEWLYQLGGGGGGGLSIQLCSKLVNIFKPVSASSKVVRPGRGVVYMVSYRGRGALGSPSPPKVVNAHYHLRLGFKISFRHFRLKR